jgi:hypothetical protein
MKSLSQLGWIGLATGILLIILLCSILAFFAGKIINPPGTPIATRPWPTSDDTATPLPTNTPIPTSTQTSTPTPTQEPTPAPTATPIVTPRAIRNLGRLITVEHELQVYLIYETKPDWWPFSFWTNKIILLAVGTVQAGVDLDKMKDEDLIVNGTRVQIILPPPEVFGEPNMLLDESQVLEGSTFNPIKMDWNDLIEAQKQAKKAMLKWALEHGILDLARQNAEMRIELLLRRLGATQVTIKWRDYEK